MTIEVPALTADQMREVERLMVAEFRIELEQMMENAGRALAELAVDRFGPGRVIVLAGPGGNGGGGLVAARHLINRGRDVQVVLSAAAVEMSAVTARQLSILHRMAPDVAVTEADLQLADSDLIIDALLGYSLSGDPRPSTAELIRWANATQIPVLSLDTPSGLDVTTGIAADPCVAATATMTLALPKTGLRSAQQVGRLYLADISVPRALYDRMGIAVGPIFADDSIVPLDVTGN